MRPPTAGPCASCRIQFRRVEPGRRLEGRSLRTQIDFASRAHTGPLSRCRTSSAGARGSPPCDGAAAQRNRRRRDALPLRRAGRTTRCGDALGRLAASRTWATPDRGASNLRPPVSVLQGLREAARQSPHRHRRRGRVTATSRRYRARRRRRAGGRRPDTQGRGRGVDRARPRARCGCSAGSCVGHWSQPDSPVRCSISLSAGGLSVVESGRSASARGRGSHPGCRRGEPAHRGDCHLRRHRRRRPVGRRRRRAVDGLVPRDGRRSGAGGRTTRGNLPKRQAGIPSRPLRSKGMCRRWIGAPVP